MATKTMGGIAGRVAGAVKEKAGEALGDEQLAREGRLQKARGAADMQAARHAVTADAMEASADRREHQAERLGEAEALRADREHERRTQSIDADRARREVDAAQAAGAEQVRAAELRGAGARHERHADAVDPEQEA
jgi:uncharacterized protein YjbJ (UPF0337 family)